MSKNVNITPTRLKGAWFCVAIMGKTQNSMLVQGWDDLVSVVEKAFYGDKPSLQDRVAIVRELSNWADWVPDFSGLPFHKMTQNDDSTTFCEIFRIIDARNLPKEATQ